MSYADGFVLVVPKKNKAAYRKMALDGAKSWLKHGALSYFECVGTDFSVDGMDGLKNKSFPEMANAKKTDDVWFSFITYKSKKHRDQVLKKVMKEMGEQYDPSFKMPFDMTKMAKGGFETVVEKHKK